MRKIVAILLLMIILLMSIFTITTNAINITSADLYSKGVYNGLLNFGNIRLECNYVVYEKDGIEYPAYCMQRELDGVTQSNAYNVSINRLVTNVSVWRTIINGYPYKSISELGCQTEIEAFLATKQAVYCALYNRDPNEYSATSEAGERCLNALKQIVNASKNSNVSKVSSSINITEINSTWKVDNVNDKYISKEFKANASAPINTYSISLNGTIPEGTQIVDINNSKKTSFISSENFKIIIPIINVTQDGDFDINVSGEVKTKPVFYGKSENSLTQDYALTAGSYEDGTGILKVYYTKNETKIIILKQDEKSEERLKGVKFNLLDKDQKEIYTELITDEEGKIVIDNLPPATYYIKEIETLEGYEIYDKLIKIEPDLNEEVTIIVNNNEREINVERDIKKNTLNISKKSSETAVKLPKTGM